jgi:predicted  nucleic acid-binding Zn-ribbon protein
VSLCFYRFVSYWNPTELVEDLEYNLADANDRVEELLASVESYKNSTSALTAKLKKFLVQSKKPKGVRQVLGDTKKL